MMTSRRRATALFLFGLSFSLGCGGGTSSFHQGRPIQGRPNQVCRKDAAVNTAARPVDAAVDAFTSLDSASDLPSPDSDSGVPIDLAPAEDGQGDAGESADACEDGQGVEVGRVCGPSPWILEGQVPNVRQLGGVPLSGGGAVACDLVYRGSALSSMTPEGCAEFAAMGIKTVVDLRSESEQTSPPAACVVERARLVSAPMPTPYNVSPADYLADLYTAPTIQKAFAVLADRAAYPVYYHCLYGKDRTGVLTAVILTALGASRPTIHAEYALSGDAGFAYYPASLDAVLDEFERLGGIDAYFRAVGVPAEHVQAMRAILLAP